MTAHNSISSNAFNSASFVSNGVDARTGLYTATINLPELNGNQLNGPALQMGLSFSPINTQDSGFGVGWDLALTQFNPDTRILSLASGETFKVTGSGSEPEIAERKLETFKFFDLGDGGYRVVHKSGLIETLKLEGISGYVLALPVQVHSPQGHSLTLSYQPYGNSMRLHEVKEADGTPLLNLTYNSGTLNIRYLAGASNLPLAVYTLQWDDDQLRYLTLPSSDHARWTFNYQIIGGYTCLQKLRSPQGAVETIEHNGRHSFPDSSRPGLPRVTKHVLDPRREQPPTETRYTYSTGNFLGFGARGLTWNDDGLDNLYRVTEPYEYFTTQTRYENNVAGRTLKSTFNRYHLLTEQVTTNGKARYINATQYHLDDNLPFNLQMPQCQLPRKVLSRWTLVDDPTSLRDEVQTFRFDAFGNKTEHIDTNGTRQTWTYYSALGEPGCPPDPYAFCRQLKEQKRYPAQLRAKTPAAKVRLTGARRIPVKNRRPPPSYADEPVSIARFTYSTHPPLAGGPTPMLVLDTCISSALTQSGEQHLGHSTYSYYDCPNLPECHGKPYTTVEEHNGYSSTLTHEYDYGARDGCLTHKQRIDHDLDGTFTQSVTRLALYTGLPVETQTAEGRILRYEYDGLQRIVSEEVTSADARYPAIRRYSYSWPTGDGRFAEHREVDAEGVESVQELDGLGRKIHERRQKADGSADETLMRLIYSARYNPEMQMIEETEHDWFGEEPKLLTQGFEYDQWDQQCRTIDADGIGDNTLIDPFEVTVTQWRDGMARTVTRNNSFGKPESVSVYPAEPTPNQSWLKRELSFYDCYGQLRRSIASNGAQTLYQYDVLGRLAFQRLPDGTRIEQKYAEHSQSALITELRVTQSQRASTSKLVGSQRYDGLERVTQRTEGARTTQFRYRDNLDVVDERITPAQQTIRYDYDLRLGNEAIATHADESCDFDYHPITAALTAARSPAGTITYQYDRTGRLALERSEVDGKTREVSYRESLQGRPLEQTEHIGDATLATVHRYDEFGRIEQTTEGYLRTDFAYNALGQLARTTTQELGLAHASVTELEYDDLGREVLRIQRLTGSPERRTTLTWASDGELQSRQLHVGAQLVSGESFMYDLRGRLIEHACTGTDLPLDPYGKPIIRQQFDFDGLDNLRVCITYFSDDDKKDSKDIAQYFYADDDPCQLRGLTHTHPAYPPETLFSYDADGNLTTDAHGRQLQYDRQGRLLQVTLGNGAPLRRYRYDPHDHLLGVTRSMDAETLRFYQGVQVRSSVGANGVRLFSYASAVPLGQQRAGEPQETLLTLCGDDNTVLAELKGQGPVKKARYTCYGDSGDSMDSALAYNGELRDADTGWYLLGKGYRAYDPQLRRFHSPDNAAPFGPGGLNPYAYCEGNPIRFSDPSGHFIHPRIPQIMFAEMVAAGASKRAFTSVGMDVAIGALFAIVMIPFTGGTSVGVFATGMAIDLVEAVARASMYYEKEKKGDVSRIGWLDTVDNVMTGVMVIHVGKAILTTWAQRAAKRAAANLIKFNKLNLGHTPPPRRGSFGGFPGLAAPDRASAVGSSLPAQRPRLNSAPAILPEPKPSAPNGRPTGSKRRTPDVPSGAGSPEEPSTSTAARRPVAEHLQAAAYREDQIRNRNP